MDSNRRLVQNPQGVDKDTLLPTVSLQLGDSLTPATTLVDRQGWLRQAFVVECVSVAWVAVEAVVSGFVAFKAGSLALTAFSVDSGVELLAGFALLVRLVTELRSRDHSEANRAERVASGIVATCLFCLAGYIAIKSGQALHARVGPAESSLGILIALLSSIITPFLARAKKRLGVKLHSHALLGDAACSMTCAYMAWTLLCGLVALQLFGWWWLDAVAALGILYFVVREAWESAYGAWNGEAHVH